MSLEKAIGKEIDRLLSCIITSESTLRKKCSKEMRERLTTVVSVLHDEVTFWKGMGSKFGERGYEHPGNILKVAREKYKEEMKKKVLRKRMLVFMMLAFAGFYAFYFLFSILSLFYVVYIVSYSSFLALSSSRKAWNESLVHAYEMDRRNGGPRGTSVAVSL